ncbi:MAG: ABC transporter permease [Solirubrobacterales bacterium]
MIGGVPLARRNLTRQRLRFALSAAGVGLALLLILSLEAIYGGVLRQVTAYPDHAGAPVIVSQRGVKTMHMSSSALPLGLARKLRRDPRVARAAPILYSPIILNGREPVSSYLIGFRRAGGPWQMSSGRARPGPDGIVIDAITAGRLGVGIGDTLRVAGGQLRIVGLTRGTFSIISSVSFIAYATFQRLEGTTGSASYILVWPRRGRSPEALASHLQAAYPVTAQTSGKFSTNERQVVSDMSTELIQGLVSIGFVVGLVVAGLSIYTATVARLREYAVLKAIGMRNRSLYWMISRQALLTVGSGLLVALALLALLNAVVGRAEPSITMQLTSGILARTALVTTLIGAVAALLPARRVARVDPASAYRT